MITEDYVSFEIAKLLKEKGFDEETNHEIWYVIKQFSTGCHWNSCTYKVGDITREYDKDCCISMPTLQMVMKWLREAYNIYFSIEPYTIFPENINCKVFYSVEIQQLVTDNEGTLYKGELEVKHYIDDIESYEEACEAAIKYCLENLI